MPKKYLPKRKPQNQEQNLNLLFQSDADIVAKKLAPTIVVLTTYFCVAVGVLTLILIATNNSLDRRLQELVLQRNTYLFQIASMSKTENDIKEIISLTNKHKEIKTQRLFLFPRVDYIFDKLSESPDLREFSYGDDVFKLSVTSPKALDIAVFITKILDSDYFGSVIINSVTFNSRDGKYTSELEVSIKR